MRVYALACLLLAGFVGCEKRNYHGSHIMTVKASYKDQVDLIASLAKTYDMITLREVSLKSSGDFVVSKENMQHITNALTEAEVTYTVHESDLQYEIDAEKRENMLATLRGAFKRSTAQSDFPDHERFYRYEEVNRFLHNFANYYPELVVLKTMNQKTPGGKTVYYLEIGSPVGSRTKPVIFIEGLTHAREWAGGAAVLYTIDMLLRGYKLGSLPIVDALQKYTWVFVPIVNPDGYAFTWSSDRMWRKNRRQVKRTGSCIGVDLNRNYDVMWGTTGVGDSCHDPTYPGEFAFSEPETQNIRDLFRSLKPRVVAFLSVHAFSQLLLYPWGYIDSDVRDDFPSNVDELKRVGQLMANQLPGYTFGTAYGVLGYGASGASEDWALHDKPGIYSYTYEVRPRRYSKYHFLLPPNQIRPTGQEFMRSVIVMAQNMKLT